MSFRLLTKEELLQFFRYELSYTVSRKYPFKRQKPFEYTVLGLFFLAFAWFTVFNIATLGYSKETVSRIDPNSTMERKDHWYNNVIFTLGDNDLDPKCQETNLAVGSQFMTTNMGLHYTLIGVSFNPGGTLRSEQRSSISYLNNDITNCRVTQVDIILRKKDNSQPGKNWWWSWGGSTVNALGQCDVTITEGPFSIAFSTTYTSIPEVYDYLVTGDAINHSSAWWGSRLLDASIIGLENLMTDGNLPTYTEANLQFNLNTTPTAKSIREKDFFSIDNYYFLSSDGVITNTAKSVFHSNVSEAYNNLIVPESRPMTEAFATARIWYSLVLVDLGNSEASNLLLDDDMLQYILNPPDNFNRQRSGPLNNNTVLDWWRWGAIAPPGTFKPMYDSIPMDQAFSNFRDQTGPLGTQGASIYSQYICSVTRAKGRTTIILFALIADIALLQATWAVFKFFIGRWLEVKREKYPNAMCCEGCVSQEYHEFSTVQPEPENGGRSTLRTLGSETSSYIGSTRGLLGRHHDDDGDIV
ncbi:MAG: hypothetical protein M1820_003728 [Bogoriella megaspora]|nr:MAG: hypothetical protein M1820_003728 [Bogoriella megaspora]